MLSRYETDENHPAGLAERFAATLPPDEPVCVLVAGLPAAGKTTLAARLRLELALTRPVVALDKDEVNADAENAAMSRLTHSADRDSDAYRRLVLSHTMEVLAATAKTYLNGGVSVLIDAPSIDAARTVAHNPRPLSKVAAVHSGIPFTHAIWLTVDADTQQRRMVRRGAARDVSKLADFDAYRAVIDGIDPSVSTVEAYSAPGFYFVGRRWEA